MIEQFLVSSDNDIFTFIQEKLKNAVTDNVNYLYLDTGNPIMLVAHLDTLTNGFLDLNISKGIIKNRLGVLGADDRAGIYALYKLIDTGCSILITNFEETGGIGVNKFISDNHVLSCNLMIELDRRGANEYVYYNPLPDEVRQFVESYGYHEAVGYYSDISDLTHAYGIPSFNLSVGYYKQHTKNEYLVVSELENTIKKVKEMIKTGIDFYEVPDNFDDYWDHQIDHKFEKNDKYNPGNFDKYNPDDFYLDDDVINTCDYLIKNGLWSYCSYDQCDIDKDYCDDCMDNTCFDIYPEKSA